MPLPAGDKIVGQKMIGDKNFFVVKKRDGKTYLEPKKDKPMKKKLKLIRRK
jgi:hypothetical protein